MEELVSIILPVYNGEKYLSESIESVIEQTHKNWELIIVDDCSSDNTSNIAKQYEKIDKRIHYYRNDINLRLPKNLNKGFSLAKGNYLTWTSDDNRYKSNAIEVMYKTLSNNQDIQFTFASCRIIDEKGVGIEYIMQGDKTSKVIVGSNPVGACFMYTRKVYETIGGYDPEFTLVEDFDYWQKICMRFKYHAIKEILYEYRLHDSSLTGTLKKEEFNIVLEKMLKKNIVGFGKLDWEQKYHYYGGVYHCRKAYDRKNNPYFIKYQFYSLLYFFRIRIPNKLNRIIKGS